MRNLPHDLRYSGACKENIDLQMAANGKSNNPFPCSSLCHVHLFVDTQILTASSMERFPDKASAFLSLQIKFSSSTIDSLVIFLDSGSDICMGAFSLSKREEPALVHGEGWASI